MDWLTNKMGRGDGKDGLTNKTGKVVMEWMGYLMNWESSDGKDGLPLTLCTLVIPTERKG